MVYVLNQNGVPIMPTENHAKVRVLLKHGKAKVVRRTPFTIQLLYSGTNYTQKITLGVDAGSKHIGLSATTETKELYASDVILRNDIADLLSVRRQNRRTRRNHKTRYRKPRFLNRISAKKGWIAPSVREKVQTHLTVIDKICRILPVTKIVVETAQFDIQRLKAADNNLSLPEGNDYQQGELFGFENLREYCFFRDNYTCQWCKGKSKNKILHMHHWNYWRGDHTDEPDSVITLCDVCNDSKNHKPEAKMLWGWEPKITRSYKDAAFMGIMRWYLYNELKKIYQEVDMTYGYITKSIRRANNLPKNHYIDARCISGNPSAKPLKNIYCQKKVRCHNRQIHKYTILKGGIRKRNQAEYLVKGFRLFDKVLYQGKECFIFGRRSTGRMDIRFLDGTHINASVSFKNLKLAEPRSNYLTERRVVQAEI